MPAASLRKHYVTPLREWHANCRNSDRGRRPSRRLANESGMMTSRAQEKKSELDAYFQSRKDTLTGLVNKGGFYQVVSAEIEVCRRYRRTLSIAYIDCDNFKTVNDRFGHHVGDDLLRVISKTMLRKLRSSDLPGR